MSKDGSHWSEADELQTLLGKLDNEGALLLGVVMGIMRKSDAVLISAQRTEIDQLRRDMERLLREMHEERDVSSG